MKRGNLVCQLQKRAWSTLDSHLYQVLTEQDLDWATPYLLTIQSQTDCKIQCHLGYMLQNRHFSQAILIKYEVWGIFSVISACQRSRAESCSEYLGSSYLSLCINEHPLASYQTKHLVHPNCDVTRGWRLLTFTCPACGTFWSGCLDKLLRCCPASNAGGDCAPQHRKGRTNVEAFLTMLVVLASSFSQPNACFSFATSIKVLPL